MKRVATVLALWSLLAASEAEAQRYTQVALLLGYGTADEYRFGFGAKFDVALPLSSPILGAEGIHAGGRGVFHFGSTQLVDIDGIEAEVETDMIYFAGELGLVWLLRNVQVRPFGMLGAAAVQTEGVSSLGDFLAIGANTEWEFLVAPGLMVNVPLERFMIAVEADYFIAGNIESFVFYVTIGTILP